MCLHGPLSHPGPVSHRSHPEHKLKWKQTKNSFVCNGCKEPGIGNKYSCDKCNFHLHENCCLPTRTIVHAFYKKYEFLFHRRLPRKTKCIACKKVVQGFGFHCSKLNYVLHPSCANLPGVLNDGNLELHLQKNLSEPCNKCQKKGPGWFYGSHCREHNLHVACLKEQLMETLDAMHQDVKKVVTPKKPLPVKGKEGGGGGGQILKQIIKQILKRAHVFALAAPAVLLALLGLADPTGIALTMANMLANMMAKYISPSPRARRLGN